MRRRLPPGVVSLEDELEEAGLAPPKKPSALPLSEMTKSAERSRRAQAEADAHLERVRKLLDRGWEQVSQTHWRKDASDPRWSTTEVIELSAETPEDASRVAWLKQAELDAIAKARAQR